MTVQVLVRIADKMTEIAQYATWQEANRIVLSLSRAFPQEDFAWRGL